MNSMSIALIALLFPLSSPPVLVENLNLDYKAGAGQAQVSKAQFVLEDQTWNFTDATFDVRAQDGVLTIERPEDNFSYPIEADFLDEVSVARASGVWADYAPGKVIGRVQSAYLEKGKDITNLGRSSIDCRASSRNIHPIDSCIAAGRLKVATIGGLENERAINISDIDVAISRGKTTFSVRVGGIGKITGNGTTSHEPQVSTVKIKVDKVKLGILDITGRFFDEIKDQESENLKVSRPYIWVIYAKGQM
jgi:hypothetical protein